MVTANGSRSRDGPRRAHDGISLMVYIELAQSKLLRRQNQIGYTILGVAKCQGKHNEMNLTCGFID
jgi:hypothetical protein